MGCEQRQETAQGGVGKGMKMEFVGRRNILFSHALLDYLRGWGDILAVSLLKNIGFRDCDPFNQMAAVAQFEGGGSILENQLVIFEHVLGWGDFPAAVKGMIGKGKAQVENAAWAQDAAPVEQGQDWIGGMLEDIVGD